MGGKPFRVSRFATTLRRKLYREHLGLMPPQFCQDRNEPVTSFMRCAPVLNIDETKLPVDAWVADPLANSTLQLWMDTARKNREIFTEVFRIVPTNLVSNWKAYNVRIFIFIFFGNRAMPNFVILRGQNYLPKVKTGHTVADVPLARIKDRLSLVKGSLVECPLVRAQFMHRYPKVYTDSRNQLQDFLIDEKDFTQGLEWDGLNPTLAIFI